MIAVRPPEYWPRLAFMALVARADTFVLADTLQYSRQSYQNRTRLRTPQGWQWISVPLKGGQHGTTINAVRIRHHLTWRQQHRRSFTYNYRTSPFYAHFAPTVHAILEDEWMHLGALTCATVEAAHTMLGLSTRLLRASALPGTPATLEAIIDAVGGEGLVVPASVADIDGDAATHLHTYQHPTYHQNFDGFAPGMSVLDLLFTYGPGAAAILTSGSHIERLPSNASNHPESRTHAGHD